MSGLGFHLTGPHHIECDNILTVEFRLDDEQKIFISWEVAVREMQGNLAGGEFINVGKYDKFLDFI